MTLIDTSSLIHLLRKKGDPLIKERVSFLIASDLAATCPMVVTELLMGASTKEDKNDVTALCSLLHHLEIDSMVWQVAYKLASLCRNKGTPVPGSDLLIAACAFSHNANVDSADQHFNIFLSYKTLL